MKLLEELMVERRWQGTIFISCADSMWASFIYRTVFIPGKIKLCVTPCRSLTTGETAVVGEELILLLSALGERSPLTRISQSLPPWTSVIQSPPVNLHNQEMHVVNEL